MVLSSLQDQSHVASLLGYSNFGEVAALGPPLTPALSARPPSSSSVEPYDPMHLAEVLLKTLLLSIGFYTVWNSFLHCPNFFKKNVTAFRIHFFVFFWYVLKQERAFGELEKNSDKQVSNDSQERTDPPCHFHQLLSGLYKHLLAHCFINSSPEVKHSHD